MKRENTFQTQQTDFVLNVRRSAFPTVKNAMMPALALCVRAIIICVQTSSNATKIIVLLVITLVILRTGCAPVVRPSIRRIAWNVPAAANVQNVSPTIF